MFNAQLAQDLLKYPICEIRTLVTTKFIEHAKLCEKIGQSLDNDLG